MPQSFIHDPDAKLDYGIDWSTWLAVGEEIDVSTWEIEPAGPTLTQDTSDTTSTTVWVDGGTAGAMYALTNHVVTNQSREDDRTIWLRCRER